MIHWQIKMRQDRAAEVTPVFYCPTLLGSLPYQPTFWNISSLIPFLFLLCYVCKPRSHGCLWKWFPHYCPFTHFMKVIKLFTWNNHMYQLEVSQCRQWSSNRLFLIYPEGSTLFFFYKKIRKWVEKKMRSKIKNREQK